MDSGGFKSLEGRGHLVPAGETTKGPHSTPLPPPCGEKEEEEVSKTQAVMPLPHPQLSRARIKSTPDADTTQGLGAEGPSPQGPGSCRGCHPGCRQEGRGCSSAHPWHLSPGSTLSTNPLGPK